MYHCIGATILYGLPPTNFSILGTWGGTGVDLFFVISGFIMVFIQGSRPKSAAEFFRNRLLRIGPLYWLLTTALLAIVIVLPVERDLSFGYIASSYLFLTTPAGYGDPILYVGWTLEYEMAFYALFALSILLRSRAAQFALVAVGIIGLSWLYDPIALEFLMGMALGHFYLSGRRLRWPLATFALGCIALIATIPFEVGALRPILWGVPALLIVAGALYLPQTRSLKLLGDASYSIYLIQVFSIPLFYRVVDWLPSDVAVVAATAFSVATGVVLYLLVESPMTAAIRRVRNRARRSPGIGAEYTAATENLHP